MSKNVNFAEQIEQHLFITFLYQKIITKLINHFLYLPH
ncbi:hypothetical protein VCHC33A2_1173 [Vibrio cholerae HC-33A2]|nr:hypothetical protein VCHC33A2_1173 [Vibrio cholerae HC-33A2]EHI05795.1 hypothetical protein VCHC61A1_2010 [Vibrio cholerae HC-61A1]ELT25553.1 hypothetical protein VCHC7A1_02214 [Vibrio cholerae HC-7A1]KKP17269.1 hypothetical protein VS84_01280 [Vibrio cholerae]KKP22249.1 hypothetical protein VS86_02521 [Vibrio cholerae]